MEEDRIINIIIDCQPRKRRGRRRKRQKWVDRLKKQRERELGIGDVHDKRLFKQMHDASEVAEPDTHTHFIMFIMFIMIHYCV